MTIFRFRYRSLLELAGLLVAISTMQSLTVQGLSSSSNLHRHHKQQQQQQQLQQQRHCFIHQEVDKNFQPRITVQRQQNRREDFSGKLLPIKQHQKSIRVPMRMERHPIKPKNVTQSVSMSVVLAASIVFCFSNIVFAIDNSEIDTTANTATTSAYSIEKCNTASKVPCISTSNVRQLDLYSPPWTFPSFISTDEIMSRLKGAIIADPNCQIIKQTDNQYLQVDAKRPNDLFSTMDRLEFIINEQDHVITYKSIASSDNQTPDFGLQRRRLDEIRKRSAVFGIMGDTMNTADSATNDERGNGPIGQLKAFYGLQSGSGYEDVLSE